MAHPKVSVRISRRVLLLGVLILVSLGLLILRYSGYLLIQADQVPNHAQVAVVLDGPPDGVSARFRTSVDLLRQGRVDYVMISVGKVSVWGTWFPQLVSGYIQRMYPQDIARRIVLCEMNTDSTQEEALALQGCLNERGWKSVLVITSDYHAHRARRIWRKEFKAPYSISVCGVRDGDFESNGWWRNRRYAKTWLLEMTKLLWSYMTGI